MLLFVKKLLQSIKFTFCFLLCVVRGSEDHNLQDKYFSSRKYFSVNYINFIVSGNFCNGFLGRGGFRFFFIGKWSECLSSSD